MSYFHRQLWRQKPQAWGPVDTVQAALRDRLERISIAWTDVIHAIPFWNGFKDYGPKMLIPGPTVGSVFDRNALLLQNGNYASYAGAKPTEFTYFLDVTPNNIASNRLLTMAEVLGNANRDRSLYIINGYVWFYIYSSGQRRLSSTSNIPVSKSAKIAASSSAATGMKIYLEGLLSNNIAAGAAYTGYTTPELIFNYADANEIYGDNYFNSFLFTQSVLSASQILNLSENPYQLWQPKARIVYSIPPNTVPLEETFFVADEALPILKIPFLINDEETFSDLILANFIFTPFLDEEEFFFSDSLFSHYITEVYSIENLIFSDIAIAYIPTGIIQMLSNPFVITEIESAGVSVKEILFSVIITEVEQPQLLITEIIEAVKITEVL